MRILGTLTLLLQIYHEIAKQAKNCRLIFYFFFAYYGWLCDDAGLGYMGNFFV